VTDSSGDRHQIEVSVFGGVAQPFVDGQGGVKTREILYNGNGGNTYYDFSPGGAGGINILYNTSLYKKLRMQIGIGYQIVGYSIKSYSYDSVSPFDLKGYNYTGYFTVPLRLSYSLGLPKGALTLRVGTSFALGLHYVNHYKGNLYPTAYQQSEYLDYIHSSSIDKSGMKYVMDIGADLKIGYAMPLTPKYTLNVGPVINFYHLANVYGYNRDIFGIRRYDFYAGVDLAFVFGVGKKK
jgi:hypothetical protein